MRLLDGMGEKAMDCEKRLDVRNGLEGNCEIPSPFMIGSAQGRASGQYIFSRNCSSSLRFVHLRWSVGTRFRLGDQGKS